MENIKQVKGNECSQWQSIAAIFSSSLHICPMQVFSSDTQACFALVTSHNMPSNMLHTPLYPPSVFITCITWTQNMPRHDKVKINRANGQTGGKHWSDTFLLTAFISFGLFNIFCRLTAQVLPALCSITLEFFLLHFSSWVPTSYGSRSMLGNNI
jgi:hypothetical protein